MLQCVVAVEVATEVDVVVDGTTTRINVLTNIMSSEIIRTNAIISVVAMSIMISVVIMDIPRVEVAMEAVTRGTVMVPETSANSMARMVIQQQIVRKDFRRVTAVQKNQ
jgi:hypothetical protein